MSHRKMVLKCLTMLLDPDLVPMEVHGKIPKHFSASGVGSLFSKSGDVKENMPLLCE